MSTRRLAASARLGLLLAAGLSSCGRVGFDLADLRPTGPGSGDERDASAGGRITDDASTGAGGAGGRAADASGGHAGVPSGSGGTGAGGSDASIPDGGHDGPTEASPDPEGGRDGSIPTESGPGEGGSPDGGGRLCA